MLNKFLAIWPTLVIIASLIHALAPPYEQFKDYPRFQKVYRFILVLCSIIAINWRGFIIQKYPNLEGFVSQFADQKKAEQAEVQKRIGGPGAN